MKTLKERRATAALALQFTILTSARTGEVLGARWSEIDLKARIWTVPPNRMKAGKEHRVPLSGAAVQLLEGLADARTDPVPMAYVFPGQRPGRPLSGMAMEMLLRRMQASTVTVHGFRSSFRDWAGERTSFPREVAEAPLAHQVGDEVERAYRRGDALEKRRHLMEAWALYLLQAADSTVVALADGVR
jgi:integrase